MGARFRELGEVDGVYQIRRKAMKNICSNVARSTRADVETIFLGMRDSAESKLKDTEEVLSQAKKDLESDQKYLEVIKKAKRWRPRDFSKWAWLFLFFGGILLAADFALSLNTTEQGFKLVNSWEKWLMTAGITACTVFVKIYFDNYLLPSLERSVTMFKKDNLPGVMGDPNEGKKIAVVWFLRFVVNSALLVGTLYTIYMLGVFRFENLDISLPNKDIAKEVFVYLSLLFPVIGGVCLAIAIDKFRFRGLIKEAKSDYNKAKLTMTQAQKEVNLATQQDRNCVNYTNWCAKDSDFNNNYSTFFYACYIHGYEYGF